MSQYAAPADLAATGLPARALQGIDPGKQIEFLVSASGTIDTYLRGRYRLPVAGDLGPPNTFPGDLRDACVAIASWRLLVFRGVNPDTDANFRERHDFYLGNTDRGTRGWLDKLAAGAVSIDAALDATPTVDEGGGRVVDGGSRGFGTFQGNGLAGSGGVGEPIGNFWGASKPD